jgi:hypothetical protein
MDPLGDVVKKLRLAINSGEVDPSSTIYPILVDLVREYDRTKRVAFPTYIVEVDEYIMSLLNDKVLFAVCSSNKYTANICRDEQFWRSKIQQRWGVDLDGFLDGDTFKTAYIRLSKAKDDGNLFITSSVYGYVPLIILMKDKIGSEEEGIFDTALQRSIIDGTNDRGANILSADLSEDGFYYSLIDDTDWMRKIDEISWNILTSLSAWKKLSYDRKKELTEDIIEDFREYDNKDKILLIYSSDMTEASWDDYKPGMGYLFTVALASNETYTSDQIGGILDGEKCATINKVFSSELISEDRKYNIADRLLNYRSVICLNKRHYNYLSNKKLRKILTDIPKDPRQYLLSKFVTKLPPSFFTRENLVKLSVDVLRILSDNLALSTKGNKEKLINRLLREK